MRPFDFFPEHLPASLKAASLAALLVTCGVAQASPIITTFTSSSALDFSGDFTYALTMNANANGTQVGDATFTYAVGGATPGVTESHQFFIQDWHPYNFGASADDAGLSNVMRSIIWSGGGDAQVVSLTMSNLQIGQTYKAQLLFGENCCDRGFDVFHDNTKIVDDFSPYLLNGGDNTGNAAITETFIASATSATFGLGYFGGRPDWNPILNAVTLERITVPEPGSLALLLAGLGLLGASTRRSR